MRTAILVSLIGLVLGLGLGIYVGTTVNAPAAAASQAPQFNADSRTDYLVITADAYAADGNLKLAQDRLARLRDPKIAGSVEALAIEYAPKRDARAMHLIQLAVALGSRNRGLVSLVMPATATPTRTPPAQDAPVFSSVRATDAPTPTPIPPTPTLRATDAPVYVVVPNDNPYIVLPTNTFTPSPTQRPATRVPTATITPIPTAVPPPPFPVFEPDLSRWWGTIHYEPANVEPGQGYWHLAHAIYCDAFDGSDPRRGDFGCDEMPGGSNGTNIYVMSGGNPIDVWRGDTNVGDDPTIVGDKKNPGDMCNCDYSFESSDYRIAVRGAPSDSIGGFCLCGKNFGWGSRAHVRYFLYFEYRIR